MSFFLSLNAALSAWLTLQAEHEHFVGCALAREQIVAREQHLLHGVITFVQHHHPMILPMVQQKMVLAIREGNHRGIIVEGHLAVGAQLPVKFLGTEFELQFHRLGL